MKKYYLAYGSNLNLLHMKKRCRDSKPVGTLNLNGYRLAYKGSEDEYAYLTVEKSEDNYVPLGVFKVSKKDEAKLDIYEGYPDLYYKAYVPIKIDGVVHKALIYIMKPEFNYHVPSEEYIQTCIDGYDDFGFDKNLLEEAFEISKGNGKSK